MEILDVGFETSVRSLLGIDIDDLPNVELNSPLIVDLAEAVIIKRVPDYATVTDDADLLFIQSAVVNYICYLVCPSMTRRLNLEVSISDVKIKKDRVDWNAYARSFLGTVENSLSKVTSVEVITFGTNGAPWISGVIKGTTLGIGERVREW